MRANDNAAAPGELALEQAADWIDRLDELTAAEELELRAWLAASAANAEAFERMRRIMLDTALIEAADHVRERSAAVVHELPPGRAPQASSQRRRISPGLGLVAASVAGLAVAAALFAVRTPPRPSEPELQFATAVGARSDYRLSDASVVHLNADSKVSVRFTRDARSLTLQRGDAMFDVAKNPARPFTVAAGTATVTAVGTSFEVDRLGDSVEVRVFEGVVRVAPAQGPPQLARKGEWLRLSADGPPTGGRFAPELDETWRSDWLVAEQTPLKYVVARLNRYTDDQIVVADLATRELKVTGRFRLSRTDDALAMISALAPVEAVRNGKRIDVVVRRPGG